MFAVETTGLGSQEPFHARDPIGTRRLHDQMKMMGHQAQGVHLPAGLAADFPKRVKQQESILVSVQKMGSRRSPRFMT
ncbi:MAG: hypothetical protein JWR19_3731 [Pedosphaera sp.]|nr:hypothetical protein [Pedosphaera sp.]